MLEDGSGVLVQQAAHVAVLPGEQPFQEADVATPRRDEQCHVRREPGSLDGEGWEAQRRSAARPCLEAHVSARLPLARVL